MQAANRTPLTPRQMVATIVLFSMFICTVVLVAGSLYALNFVRSDPPPQSYEYATVMALCRLFDFPIEDDFCTNAGDQNKYTLEVTLKRYFAPGKAGFDQIMRNVEIRDVDFSDPNNIPTYAEIAEMFLGFAGGYCLKDAITIPVYSCTIVFKEEVGYIYITFARDTDTIMSLGVGWRSG